MMFEVSDKIVCINSKGLAECRHLFTGLPVEGQMYVVREMDYHPETLKPDNIPGVLLVGIFGCDWQNSGEEFSFNALRFVKLNDYREKREDYIQSFGRSEKEIPLEESLVPA